MSRAPERRQALFGALLALASVGAVLVGLELGLRLAPGVMPLALGDVLAADGVFACAAGSTAAASAGHAS